MTSQNLIDTFKNKFLLKSNLTRSSETTFSMLESYITRLELILLSANLICPKVGEDQVARSMMLSVETAVWRHGSF